MKPSKLEMTPTNFRKLKRLADEERSLYAAAKAFKVVPNTIKAACKKANLSSWLADNFPNRQGQGGAQGEMRSKMDGTVRRLKPEQIKAPLVVPDNAQTRWLTKSWSKAA